MILAGVYNFAFINDKEELTRTKYAIYHSVCYAENVVMVTLWGLYGAQAHWYYLPGKSFFKFKKL